MNAGASVSRNRQVILCGLEVLRLIGERVENRQDVDGDDIRAVLEFLRDVAHRYLDNTEQLLRRADQTSSLETTLINHGQARTLFAELMRTNAMAPSEEFAELARFYTGLLADLIVDEHRYLRQLSLDVEALHQFSEVEREIHETACLHRQLIHRLETKYTSPHCI